MRKNHRLKDKGIKVVNFTDLPSELPKMIKDKSYETILGELEPNNLTEKERGVLRLRVCGYTMKDIGKHFNHSRGWANETFKSAVKKIKNAN